MSKKANDNLRQQFTEKVVEMFRKLDEEVLIVGSNEIAIPCVDEEGNDAYCCITIKVPTGSRDGDPYDGYAMAQEYQMKQAEKKEKAAKAAKEKAAKIARDEAMRAKRAEAKAKREG